jgi:hypothetical protein
MKWYGADFVIVQVMQEKFTHVTTVYLHRENKNFEWRALVCDPEIDRSDSDVIFEELKLLGQRVLEIIHNTHHLLVEVKQVFLNELNL